MIKKIQTYLLTAFMVLLPAATVLVPAGASAAGGITDTGLTPCNSISGGVQAGINAATNTGSGAQATTNCTDDGLSNSSGLGGIASKIVNIFSIIVGAVSIIMIIFGGFRYITSGGDSGRVGGAKNTLLYALIGLVIVALAQVIVHFVLSQANNVGS